MTYIKQPISIPKADYTSPSDFISTYNSTSSLYLTQASINLDSPLQIAYIRWTNPITKASDIIVNGSDASFNITSSGSGYTIDVYNIDGTSFSGTTFSSSSYYSVGINGKMPMYDQAYDSEKVIIQNPVWNNNVIDSLQDGAYATTQICTVPATIAVTASILGVITGANIITSGSGYTAAGILSVDYAGGYGGLITYPFVTSGSISGSLVVKASDKSALGSGYTITSSIVTASLWTAIPSEQGMSMDGYTRLSLTGKLQPGTGSNAQMQVWATNDEDLTVATGVEWVLVKGYDTVNDIVTNEIATSGSLTTRFAIDYDNFNYKYFRLITRNLTTMTECIIKARRS